MAVERLDHVNIRTDDIPGTVQFFADVLGLIPGPAPGRPPETHVWMLDQNGGALVHINAKRSDDGEGAPGAIHQGAIHHIAFACTGYDDLLRELSRRGVERRETYSEDLGLRQVFFHEPNGTRIECGFSGS